jgi:hypothetical protein
MPTSVRTTSGRWRSSLMYWPASCRSAAAASSTTPGFSSAGTPGPRLTPRLGAGRGVVSNSVRASCTPASPSSTAWWALR